MKKTTNRKSYFFNLPSLFVMTLFTGIVCFTSCHKDVKKDKGIIIEELGDVCAANVPASGEYVITSSAELSAALAGSGCNTSSFNVDFTKNTLIGKHVTGKCKFKKIFNQVKRDDSSKRIQFSILLRSKGNCATEFSQWSWVVVPNFPSDYTVFFAVEER